MKNKRTQVEVYEASPLFGFCPTDDKTTIDDFPLKLMSNKVEIKPDTPEYAKESMKTLSHLEDKEMMLSELKSSLGEIGLYVIAVSSFFDLNNKVCGSVGITVKDGQLVEYNPNIKERYIIAYIERQDAGQILIGS